MGQLNVFLRNPERADTFFKKVSANYKAEELSPTILAVVGDHLLGKGETAKAAAYFEYIKEHNRSSEYADFGFAGLAEILLQQKKFKEALELCNEAVDNQITMSKEKEIKFARARALAETQAYPEAKKAFEEILQTKEWRGDATAAILILLVNLLGGIAIGPLMHDMSLGDAARVYTTLTIGDGLVAQIPALLLSMAVAVIVTRMSREQDIGAEVARQLVGDPRLIAVAAVILGLLGLIPGMPNIVFLGTAILAAWLARHLQGRELERSREAQRVPLTRPRGEPRDLSWEDLPSVDLIGLEVGYRLVPLVDAEQGGDLMPRIRGVRLKLTQELGFLIPAVHIRDDLELAPNAYRISLSGVPVGEGIVHPERELAIDPGRVFGTLEGLATRDPAFGLDALWIEPALRERAQSFGYTVVDAGTVIATHLGQLVGRNAHELLGHEEVQNLLANLAKSAPKLVEDLVPKILPLGVLVKVLQGLLSERVPIRNLRAILEALAEIAPKTQESSALIAQVRLALARQIVQDIAGLSTELPVITLDAGIEQALSVALT
ncbi:MAG: hypothetical protein EBR15_05440, partial [Gammaproteobacteria bacterium]|nr:hypothetical protein [Gammaproteobacteria bacterium]